MEHCGRRRAIGAGGRGISFRLRLCRRRDSKAIASSFPFAIVRRREGGEIFETVPCSDDTLLVTSCEPLLGRMKGTAREWRGRDEFDKITDK